MRVRARKDSNHTEVVKAFRDLGASVLDTAQLGNGAGDIIVGLHNHNVMVEIKDGAKPPSARKLTPDEVQFHDEWKGWIEIVYSIDDVVSIVKRMVNK
jgi:hypothetical protein